MTRGRKIRTSTFVESHSNVAKYATLEWGTLGFICVQLKRV